MKRRPQEITSSFQDISEDLLEEDLAYNDDEKIALEDAPEPVSVGLMRRLLTEILIGAYGIKKDDVESQPVIFDDETFAYHFKSVFVSPEADQFEDPDFHDAMREMLSDLKAYTDIKTIYVSPSDHYVEAKDKLSLLYVLKELAKEKGLNSIDSVTMGKRFNDNCDDEYQTHVNIIEGLRSAGRQMESLLSDRKTNNRLFAASETSPSVSLAHYHAKMARAYAAELTVSFDHIYKTILQEDGIQPLNPRKDLMKHGGYN